jgi:hypothetical protein
MNEKKPEVQVTPEEAKACCNVAIAEAALGYERRMLEGRFKWYRPKEADGGEAVLELAELPNFFENDNLALDLFRRFAIDMDLVPQLRFNNLETPDHRLNAHCYLYRREPGKRKGGKTMLVRAAGGSAPNIAPAIALAAVDLYGVPMSKLHREIFPGRYLAVVP